MNKVPIVHCGEYGLWRACVSWQNKANKSSILKEEVTCKRCIRIMGWKMTKVKACKPCGIMVEMNVVSEKDNSKIAIPIQKCPLCGEELTNDDSENYED